MIWPFSVFAGGGVARLTPDLRAELEPEGIIAVAERVPASQRFSGSVPGRHDGLGISRHKGLLVFTNHRLYALLPSAPRLKEPVINQPWDVPQEGPARVAIDESGVVLSIDLRQVDVRFSGEVTTKFKATLTGDALDALPKRVLAFHVSPAYVFSSLGVRVRP